MSPVENYPANVQSIDSRLSQLKTRQHRVILLSLTATVIFMIALAASFTQQTLVYSFFDLSQQIEQLHIPVAIGNELLIHQQPDYFTSLLSWFGWLILKLFVAFFAAFIFVRILKKFKFFQVRFRSLILRFVAWLIGFILIWSGLTYLQYDAKSDESKAYEDLVAYDKTIQQSQIADDLKDSDAPNPVKDYLLAQTALLHRPVDKDAALPYISNLIRSERVDPHFMEYGFKPEQLWIMQQQIYGKAVTPIAQSVQKQANQAQQLSEIVQLLCWGLSLVAALLAIITYVLAMNLKNRASRIEQKD
ncbi:hypothetical protein IAE19_15550 [Acinetobacter sp. S40]|uniref:hypothetical protein n=1 Tax=unclassified Acinetobacter TaxID=196816 RepID=UPI00190A549E|nr:MULTISPECIES: hypothetical protein [unclassified Acinetobacter]MBJ9986845.1 hypothetical protein [Acinetobacter sp. S40]MBK0064880.1 hypothetical protein [Acinetobacter sp. S55]MBK0068377.1 hypothetical protein [Acinetobacter sp. S54]